jgi:uncharacterized protein YkwD
VSFGLIRRSLAPLLVAATAGTAFIVVAPSTAYADSTYSMEAQFIAKVNAARQANGQAPYSIASDLTSVARQQSANMASRTSLYHNPSLTTQVPNWQAVGENVGEGPDVNDIHVAFMNSPEHRANILDPSARFIGSWTKIGGHKRYNTIDFVGSRTTSYNTSYGSMRTSC